MKKQVVAILKWQYWLYNHGNPKEIIKCVFPDLWEHLTDKFNHYANKTGNTAFAWSCWFMELSGDRQEKFAAWVMENYHGIDSRIKNMGEL